MRHRHKDFFPDSFYHDTQSQSLRGSPLKPSQGQNPLNNYQSNHSCNYNNHLSIKQCNHSHSNSNSPPLTASTISTPSPPTSTTAVPASFSLEHLDLPNFKTRQCQITTPHNHKHCQYFHNNKDKRRSGNHYTADLCPFADGDLSSCPNGDLCTKSHNHVEQLYRPDKYKSKFCSFYPNQLEKCEYGPYCSFAHSEEDINIELLHNYLFDTDFFMFHYKTQWCPFNLTHHDKARCVYAHNWQDYRRKPHISNYEPAPCSNWKSQDFILNYNEGCPIQHECTKCHGWKELEYHPLIYRTKMCSAGRSCKKYQFCPFSHNAEETRVLPQNLVNKIFKLYPRNRVITNTFKPDKKTVNERGGKQKKTPLDVFLEYQGTTTQAVGCQNNSHRNYAGKHIVDGQYKANQAAPWASSKNGNNHISVPNFDCQLSSQSSTVSDLSRNFTPLQASGRDIPNSNPNSQYILNQIGFTSDDKNKLKLKKKPNKQVHQVDRSNPDIDETTYSFNEEPKSTPLTASHLGHPVNQIHSHHESRLRRGSENLFSQREALQDLREKAKNFYHEDGHRLPPGLPIPRKLTYDASDSYVETLPQPQLRTVASELAAPLSSARLHEFYSRVEPILTNMNNKPKMAMFANVVKLDHSEPQTPLSQASNESEAYEMNKLVENLIEQKR